jgi:(2S)-methylsuccinyl-CoA dehydrogenase
VPETTLEARTVSMSKAALKDPTTVGAPLLPDLLPLCRAALDAAEAFGAAAQLAVAQLVAPGGKVDAGRLEREQFAAHGYAWLATYVAALREMLHWAERLEAAGQLGELEQLMLQAAYGEYLNQMSGGIALSQVEVLRPHDLGLSTDEVAALLAVPAVKTFMAGGNSNAARMAIAGHLTDGRFGEAGLADEMLEMIRDQFRKVAEDHKEAAHQWHLKDELIPLEVVEQLAGLGVFGLTPPLLKEGPPEVNEASTTQTALPSWNP